MAKMKTHASTGKIRSKAPGGRTTRSTGAKAKGRPSNLRPGIAGARY